MVMTQPKSLAQGNGQEVYDDGHLRVEHENYFASCGGRLLKLPRAEFLILSRLAQNPGRIVTAEDLWQHVWGDSRAFNTESLHVYIYRLRRKLEPLGIKIDTMIHVGYRLIPAAQQMAETGG
jgi:DNA-binding response OmpR family regulator